MTFLQPSPSIPGAALACDSASGDGQISIDGVVIEGSPVGINGIPFKILIKPPDFTMIVDGSAELPLSGSWDKLVINFGIDANEVPYGSIYFERSQVMNGVGQGEAMQCRMLNISSP